MAERFIAVKAQLDSINKAIEGDIDRAWKLAAGMKEALTRIAEIKDDNAGNGLELARHIARAAIADYEAQA